MKKLKGRGAGKSKLTLLNQSVGEEINCFGLRERTGGRIEYLLKEKD